MTVSLLGMTKVKFSQKEFKAYLSNFKNVKSYNESSDMELIVYTNNQHWLGAKDINTNDFWINLKLNQE